MKVKIVFVFVSLFFYSYIYCQQKKTPEFVSIQKYIPSIKVELRYASNHNFIGHPIKGYFSNNAILTIEAAKALKKAQQELIKKGYSLIIYDAYRPQKAVTEFVQWAKNLNDTLMKEEFYPTVAKKNLFNAGYISSHSRHSSGSTVDLSIVSLKTNQPIDMGSPYDFFGKPSWITYNTLSKKQKANRTLLQTVMNKSGFRNYAKEWWHFTLRNEPYRNRYFNFNVE